MHIDPDKFWLLNSAPKRLPKKRNGKPPHIATIFRWASHGLSGRKLKTIRIGGQIYCCDEWLADFIAALASLSRRLLLHPNLAPLPSMRLSENSRGWVSDSQRPATSRVASTPVPEGIIPCLSSSPSEHSRSAQRKRPRCHSKGSSGKVVPQSAPPVAIRRYRWVKKTHTEKRPSRACNSNSAPE